MVFVLGAILTVKFKMFWRKFVKELNVVFINLILGYLAVIISYFILSKEKEYSYLFSFFRRLIPAVLLSTMPLYFLPQQSTIPIFFCGTINMLTFPLLYYWTNHKGNISFSFPYDFSFGVYIIAFLASLQLIGQNLLPNNFMVISLSLLEILLLVIPIMEIVYYCYYGENISLYAILAVLNTERQEVSEYLKNIKIVKLFLSILLPISLFMLIIYANISFVHRSNISTTMIGVALASMCFAGYYIFIGRKALYKRTGIFVIYKDSVDYCTKAKNYCVEYEKRYNKLQVKSAIKEKEKETIIIVIGESANRRHMSAFSDYERVTTPWLSSKQGNDDFFLFPNAYSTWAQTVPSLEMALTEKNQYNGKNFEQAYSFVDMAKKAGFKTWWFSNQGYIGKDDTPITLVAKTSDVSHWVLQDYSVVQYDGVLLDYIKKIDKEQNNFVVLHLKGSHSNFHNRYPESFAKWKEIGKHNVMGEYDNSILYTDTVLEKIFNFAKNNLNLQAMVYFSDHGIEVKKKRMPGFVGFENLRIPFFVYLAEDYRKKFPETAEALASHTSSYFTNDLVYDLICGILQIRYSQYNPENDISSFSYSFNKSNLRTNFGKTSLADDTYKPTYEF